MHVTTKEVQEDGAILLTSVIEADGPIQMASPKARFSTAIKSVTRTESGGVQVVVSLAISEPLPVTEMPQAPAQPTDDEVAAAYLETKGLSADAAKSEVQRFGAPRVLAARQRELDEQLSDLIYRPADKTKTA